MEGEDARRSRIGHVKLLSAIDGARSGRGLVGPSFLAFAVKGIGAAAQFGFTLLAARILGADGSGLFFLALTVVTMATVISRQGTDSTITRFVAEAIDAGRRGEVRGVLSLSLRLVAVGSIALSVLVMATAGWAASMLFGKEELSPVLFVMALVIWPLAASLVQSEALKGAGWIQSGVALQSVVPWVIASALMLPLARVWGVAGAAGALVVGYVATAGAAWVLWVRATTQWADSEPGFDKATLLRASLPLLWVASINVVMNWSGSIFLGVWGTKADVGVFNAAFRTAMLVSLVLLAVNSVVGRLFAAAHQRGDAGTIRTLLHRSTKVMTLWALPMTILFVLAPVQVMALFGAEFETGGIALVVLAIAQFINVAAGSLGKLLIMTGHERAVRSAVVVTGVVSVASSLLLIPTFGVLGAAIAAAFAIVIRNVLCGWAVWRVFRIAPLWI